MNWISIFLWLTPWGILVFTKIKGHHKIEDITTLGIFCAVCAAALSIIIDSSRMNLLESSLYASLIISIFIFLIIFIIKFTALPNDLKTKKTSSFTPVTYNYEAPSAGPSWREVIEYFAPHATEHHPGAPRAYSKRSPYVAPTSGQVRQDAHGAQQRENIPGSNEQKPIIDRIRRGASDSHPSQARIPSTNDAPSNKNRPGVSRAHDQRWNATRRTGQSATNSPEIRSGLLNPDDWQVESFLARAGYKVGVQGPTSWRRRDALRIAYATRLPSDLPLEYRLDCGEPESLERLQRIIDHLQWLLRLNRNRRNWAQALQDWRSDLSWLQDQYKTKHPHADFSDR